jgi:chemosensory pili system protein ChpA (sensor histidine kinase/response regulator)
VDHGVAWRWAEGGLAAQAAARLRPGRALRLDREVLKVVKTGDTGSPRRLQALSLGLAAGAAAAPRVASFWTLAAGFFEAPGRRGFLPRPVREARASRVLLQYATLARGDSVHRVRRLGQDLLFFCAQAVPARQRRHRTLRTVRQAWGIGGASRTSTTR